MALASKANSEDNSTWEQTMNGPERDSYITAAKEELESLEKKDACEVVSREDWMKVLPCTWVFRFKRFPDESVRKLKACFCVRADRQVEGIDFLTLLLQL